MLQAALRPARAGPLRPLAFEGKGRPGPVRHVRFTLPLQTRFGESVNIVGSFSGWDPAAGVRLHWDEGDVWTGEAELPAGEPVEYKYVVVSEQSGAVAWQPGANRVLSLPGTNSQPLVVLDDWAGQRHEVKPAEPEGGPAAAEPPSPAAAAAVQPAAPATAQPAREPEPLAVLATEQLGEDAPAPLGSREQTLDQVHPLSGAAPAAAAAAAPAPAKEAPPTAPVEEGDGLDLARGLARESWRSVLAATNQPQPAPQPAAAAVLGSACDAVAPQPAAAVLADAADAVAHAKAFQARAAALAWAASASAKAACQEAKAACLAEAAEICATQPGTIAAAAAARVVAIASGTAKPAAARATPGDSPMWWAARAVAPWIRLVLAAAFVAAAVFAFLRSPWVAARWAFAAA